jgi:uncharacterized protein (TIGR00369 family)
MQPKNPHYAEAVAVIFEEAAFIKDLGIRLEQVEPGLCRTIMDVAPGHRQHDGFIHAAVVAAMADHTAGAAAGSLIGADQFVLTAEYKINLLRPAAEGPLSCEARVIKPGNRLIIVTSEVYDTHNEKPRHVATLLGTMAVLPRPN